MAGITIRLVDLPAFPPDIGLLATPTVGEHRSELVDLERDSVSAHSVLPVDDATRAEVQANEYSQNGEHGAEQQQAGGGDDHIQRPLAVAAVSGWVPK
jgi:hypothetical protein